MFCLLVGVQMSETRCMEMRKQIEENHQDIQEFLGDLGRWRLEVERRNAKLRSETTNDHDLPQVRNVLHKKRKRTRTVEEVNKR